jgi:hypothetical protein
MPVKKIKRSLSPDEAEAIQAARNLDLPDAIIAMVAIRVLYPDKPKQTVEDTMDCPICLKGKLHFSIAACNGHIWANCTTKGCVRFMQ